jgi:hypothetical protein
MQYEDGDNQKDTAGKVKAAQEAIAQVCADYKVIVPRGAVGSFSGGGLPHGLMNSLFAQALSPQWPFCHSSLYSSNYFQTTAGCVPMSWFIAVGTDEWTLADLGKTAISRTAELYQATSKRGCPDIRFHLSKKGHTITAADVEKSAQAFAISDLAFGAFLYAPDYPDKELQQLVALANNQQLSNAVSNAEKLLAKKSLAEDLRPKIEALLVLFRERQDKIITKLKQLPQDDPVLAAWYGPLLLNQLTAHADVKSVKIEFVTALKGKEVQQTMASHAELARQFLTLFGAGGSNPGLVPDKKELLKVLGPTLPATSRAGMMVDELLNLNP